MTGKIIAEIWLDVRPFNGGPGSGAGGGSDNGAAFAAVEKALNDGLILDGPGGGIEILGAGSVSGGKTSYDVGQGFWFGADGYDPLYHKVAIGDPNGDTFNWDGTEINSKMNNLELRGYLRGPSTFTIDPATHGNDTGTVVIAGNLQVDGTTTTVNSTVVEIDDIAVQLAAEATTATLANNGGILVGTYTNHPHLLYRNSYDAWETNKHWHPSASVLKDLGGSAKRWRDLYIGRNAYIYGVLNANGNTILGDISSDTVTVNARFNSGLYPITTDTYPIGTSALRWSGIYATDGDFSNDLTVGNDLDVGGDVGATGQVSGGSLDVGGGDFTVDADGNTSSNGNMTADGFSSPGGGLNVPGGSSGEILKHNGTKLVYEDHVLSEINNVSTNTPTNNEVLKYNTSNSKWEPDYVDYSEITNLPTIPTNITQIDPGNLLDDLLGDLDSFTNTSNEIFIRMTNANNQTKGTVRFVAGTGIGISESSDVITFANNDIAGSLDSYTSAQNDVYVRLLNSNNVHRGQVKFVGGTGVDISESSDIITISSNQTIPTNITQIDPGNLLYNLLGDLDGYTDNQNDVFIRMLNANGAVKGSVEIVGGTGIAVSESSDRITFANDDIAGSLDSHTDTLNDVYVRLRNSAGTLRGAVEFVGGTGITVSESSDRITITSNQVQSDWNETDSNNPAFIKNKPTIPAAPVQSNWNEVNTSSLAYIHNKPTIPTTIASLTDTTITNITDGDILKYNSTTSKWENVRDAVVQYTVSPSPCGHYYINIVEKGDLVTVQAALHISQETGSSTSTWTSTIQAPSGGSVPAPANSIAVGTAMTTGSSSSAYKTYTAQIDQSGVIKLRDNSSPGSGFATIGNVKSNSATFLFINITFIQ